MNPTTQPAPAVPTQIAQPSPTAAADDNNGKARQRRHWTAAEKAEHLALFVESGLSQADYCDEMGLHPATFSFWCRQLRNGGDVKDGAGNRPVFAEVLVSGPGPCASAPEAMGVGSVAIHLSSGTTIEVVVGTDPEWLARLVGKLAGA
jgi:hypothetical protein